MSGWRSGGRARLSGHLGFASVARRIADGDLRIPSRVMSAQCLHFAPWMAAVIEWMILSDLAEVERDRGIGFADYELHRVTLASAALRRPMASLTRESASSALAL